MVEEQIADRDIRDPAVLDAMRRVPRHRFMPEMYASEAYADHPVPIGWEQTISQPYIVAFMTEAARVGVLGAHAKVLEIGSGSGYQAAVLAELGAEVWGIEIVAPLAARAAEVLAELGYDRVHVRAGDGFRGEPSQAPFDAILVTAAAPRPGAPARAAEDRRPSRDPRRHLHPGHLGDHAEGPRVPARSRAPRALRPDDRRGRAQRVGGEGARGMGPRIPCYAGSP